MLAIRPGLRTGPSPNAATDYAALRAEGLDLLGRLSGTQWTDFNAHDPGITILEQLCYAITDLGYRCSHPVADLVVGSADSGLASPAELLPCDPVTVDDLRIQVIDIMRTDRASVAPLVRPAVGVYFHSLSSQLRLWPDAADSSAQPLELQGLLQVAAELDDDGGLSADTALRQLTGRLHAGRALGSDFELQLLRPLNVALAARIEIDASDDPTAGLADIIERIEDRMAPPAQFTLPAADDLDLDAFFDGPLLRRGQAAALPDLPSALYASDLIHAITDAPRVRAVSALALVSPPSFPVRIAPGEVARLDAGRSQLQLLRAGLPVRADLQAALDIVSSRRSARRAASTDMTVLAPPAGRDRALARHHAVQRQLPAAYGIGPLGLAWAATPQRRAQALQLQAYLLIFDQLLANQFAQLAEAHRLLSPDVGGTQSYFSQPVDDPLLPLDILLKPQATVAFEAEGAGILRRQRFLAHLLARVGEAATDEVPLQLALPDAAADARRSLLARQQFLKSNARLGGSRGTGCDLYAGTALSPFAERLGLKYGLATDSFEIVEHILLRPVAEDEKQGDVGGTQAVPLMDSLGSADLWSQRVTFVFKMPKLDAESLAFSQLQGHVWRAIRSETPAQLGSHLQWLDEQDPVSWGAFQSAWNAFLAALRAYRWPPAAPTDQSKWLAQLALRDTRDHVVELLGLARTYPLRDLPWSQRLIVSAGKPAEVVLDYSQSGVDYTLCDSRGEPVESAGEIIFKPGSGGRLVLTTPPINIDTSYRVLASRQALDAAPVSEGGGVRQAWLLGEVRIEEGIDPTLAVEMLGGPELPLLDIRVDQPTAADAHIAVYGAAVAVLVHASQEGVHYELRDHAHPERVLSAEVTGTSGTITLTLARATEDIDLRVRGSRVVGPTDNPELRESLLDAVLPLRVRADPGIVATLAEWVVPYGGSTVLTLRSGQAGTSYQAWLRPVRDIEFVFDAQSAKPVITLPGESGLLRIERPPRTTVWQALNGYATQGAAVEGSGGDISIALNPLVHDMVLLVQAVRRHSPKALSVAGVVLIPSAVQLEAALAVLVRPDITQPLSIRATLANGATSGPWLLRDGQPGVYYQLQDAAFAGDAPGYFHQRDDLDARFNKGVEQLRIEIDLALARDHSEPFDVERESPLPPLTDATPVPVGREIAVRATRAMSGISANLNRTAVLDAMPTIRAEPPTGADGQVFNIVVVAGVAGESYTVLADERLVTGPHAGNGSDLSLPLGALQRTTVFTVLAQRPDDSHLTLDRCAELTIVVS